MIEDIYEPLSKYRDEFRERFRALAQDKFRDLTERARVDISANRKTCAEIARDEAALAAIARRRLFCGVIGGLGLLIVLGLALGYYAEMWPSIDRRRILAGGALALTLAVLVLIVRARLAPRVRALEAKIAAGKERAWSQMEALNRLYTWDLAPRLIEKTVPRLQFDPYFAAKRLADLTRLYGWDNQFNEGKSVLFAQSGVINGNPFVFANVLRMSWGEKTYYGHRQVSWTERERGADGRVRFVRRTETLEASVTAPIPVYDERAMLIYGNDAAPNLTFTREPSPLSGSDEGFWRQLKLKREIGRLKKFSRILDDESQYTLMANHEFEALFKTKDRTDEVEYRTLFTPIAQIQMLSLLKDRSVGYGDDFTFVKDHKINCLFAAHLDKMDLSTHPEQFRDWNYDRAAHEFLRLLTEYFKGVYFALAPLLAIPLYQQTRTHEDLWKGVVEPSDPASFWEYEALANYYGEDRFRHPDCITRSLLKTTCRASEDGAHRIAVTAHGYRGVPQVTTKSVRCSNGGWYDVDVKWTEYRPVEKTSEMCVSEAAEPQGLFAGRFRSDPSAVYRRAIRSYLCVQ